MQNYMGMFPTNSQPKLDAYCRHNNLCREFLIRQMYDKCDQTRNHQYNIQFMPHNQSKRKFNQINEPFTDFQQQNVVKRQQFQPEIELNQTAITASYLSKKSVQKKQQFNDDKDISGIVDLVLDLEETVPKQQQFERRKFNNIEEIVEYLQEGTEELEARPKSPSLLDEMLVYLNNQPVEEDPEFQALLETVRFDEDDLSLLLL